MPQFIYNLITNFFSSIQKAKKWVGGCGQFAQAIIIEAEIFLYIAAGARVEYCNVVSLKTYALVFVRNVDNNFPKYSVYKPEYNIVIWLHNLKIISNYILSN